MGSDAIWVIFMELPSPPASLPEGEGSVAEPTVFTPLPLGEGPGERVNISPTLHHYQIMDNEKWVVMQCGFSV